MLEKASARRGSLLPNLGMRKAMKNEGRGLLARRMACSISIAEIEKPPMLCTKLECIRRTARVDSEQGTWRALAAKPCMQIKLYTLSQKASRASSLAPRGPVQERSTRPRSAVLALSSAKRGADPISISS